MFAARKVEKVRPGPSLRSATKKLSLPRDTPRDPEPEGDECDQVAQQHAELERDGCVGVGVHPVAVSLAPQIRNARNARQSFRQPHRSENSFRHDVGGQGADQRHVRRSLEHAGR